MTVTSLPSTVGAGSMSPTGRHVHNVKYDLKNVAESKCNMGDESLLILHNSEFSEMPGVILTLDN